MRCSFELDAQGQERGRILDIARPLRVVDDCLTKCPNSKKTPLP